MHFLSILPYLRKRCYPSSCLLSTDPVIFYIMNWELAPGHWRTLEFLAALRFMKVTLLVQTSWFAKKNSALKKLERSLEHYRRDHPRHRTKVLASDPEEYDFLKQKDWDVYFINQNIFLSENLFRPLPGIPKRFDAVYDARLIHYKRHRLASGVKSLALHCHNWKDCSPEYAEETRRCMAHAHWYKDPFVEGPVRWFSTEEVNAMLNESRCGLCLSQEEGCMYAAAQYLLAGLPVVTTKNRGGRDVLFDPDYVRWVEDDPEAVAEAVREWACHPPDPWKVRQSILEKMAPHRQGFLDLMNGLVREAGKKEPWALSWPANLPNKLHDGESTPAGWYRDILWRKKRW